MEAKKIADYIVRILDDKQGVDIHLMNIRELTVLADYFVICSGSSSRMVKALMNEILDEVKKEFNRIPRVEGEALSGWMLADFGDIIVHIFSPDRRDYYSLEDLWAEAKTVLRLQ